MHFISMEKQVCVQCCVGTGHVLGGKCESVMEGNVGCDSGHFGVMWCHVLSRGDMWCHVVSCGDMWCHVVSW